MIARYTVLDEKAKKLILLRPYQIHAIESIREASRRGKPGYVWHTTGSGKTLTSYKATRNLLMDIPAIDKAIFLIDRKDLDTQTTMAFQAPVLFKRCVDDAIKLYSAGGMNDAIVAEWDEIEPAFRKALAALRVCAATPSEIPGMSLAEKKVFTKIFQNFDKLFARLKSFTNYEDTMLVEYEITEDEYEEVKQYVEELRKDNPKVAYIMSDLIDEIELDEDKYKGQSILNIVENIKRDCINKVITDFCVAWYTSKEDVMYAATHYRNGEIPNESAIKATVDFTNYKEAQIVK